MVETLPVPPHHEHFLGFRCLGSGGLSGFFGGFSMTFLISGIE
jgi:hypothetical protein